MYILILILPLFGFILAGCFGFFFGRLGSAFLTTLNLFLTFLLSIFVFYEVFLCQSTVSIKLFNWVLLDIFNISLGLLFDPLSSFMIVIVSSISMFVHLYSTAYMSHDPHLSRFMSYLSLFTFFMLILVTADTSYRCFLDEKA